MAKKENVRTNIIVLDGTWGNVNNAMDSSRTG